MKLTVNITVQDIFDHEVVIEKVSDHYSTKVIYNTYKGWQHADIKIMKQLFQFLINYKYQ